MTNIAILNTNKDSEIGTNLISRLVSIPDTTIFVYSKEKTESVENSMTEFVEIPATCETLPQMHNFIVRDQAAKGFKEYLHVIEDNVQITADPTQFLNDIKLMMNIIGMNVWLNTACDNMNYVYSKYNPRMIIEFDDPRWQECGLDGIVFTSHSNAAWITYNMNNYSDAEYLFNEQFSARMFMIIEFLARRKQLNPNSLCLMNMYPTVKSERNLFNLNLVYNETQENEEIAKQNELFQSMKLDVAPDNLIDSVLEQLYAILSKNIKKGN